MKGYTTVIKLIDPRQAEPLPDEALFTVHNYAHSFYEQYIEFPQLVQTKKNWKGSYNSIYDKSFLE